MELGRVVVVVEAPGGSLPAGSDCDVDGDIMVFEGD